MGKLFWATFALALCLLCLGVGPVLFPRTVIEKEPVTVYETVTETVTETIIEYVEVPIVVPVFVTELKQFGSYQELKDYLDTIRADKQAAVQTGWICQDYAWWLHQRATEDGWLMSYYGLSANNWHGLFGRELPEGTAHAINATYINGHTYLIEPQNFQIFPDFELEVK